MAVLALAHWFLDLEATVDSNLLNPGKVQRLTPEELSESGWRVYNDCLGINGKWEDDAQPWFAAASQAHKYLIEAIESEAPIEAPVLAKGIYSWIAGQAATPFSQLPMLVQKVWQAIARHWFSLLAIPEDETADVGGTEKVSVAWFIKQAATMNGAAKPVNGQARADRVPRELEGGKTAEVREIQPADVQRPQLETLPVDRPRIQGCCPGQGGRISPQSSCP
jgi:hypothetical protein